MVATSISRPAPSPGRRHWPDSGVIIPCVAAAILIYLVVIPLFSLLYGSFQDEVATGTNQYFFTFDNYVDAYNTDITYRRLSTSFIFALGSCLIAMSLGVTAAWIIERTDTPLRRYFFVVSLVPLLMPGVLVTIAWIFLLSNRIGWLNTLFTGATGLPSPFNIYGIGGMIWVEGLRQSTLAFLLMSAALKSMDPSLEDSATMSGAGTLATLRRVTIPLLLPALASTVLLLLVQALDAFEVPALIGIPAKTFVFTSEIFLALRDFPPDYGKGGALSVGLLVLSAIGVWLFARMTRSTERFQTVTGKAFRPRLINLGRFKWLTLGFLITYVFLVAVLPFIILLWASFMPFYQAPSLAGLERLTWKNYEFVLGFARFTTAVKNSLLLGLISATFVMLLTAIISWIVTKTKLPGRGILDYLAFVPISIPGLVLGVSLIWLYIQLPIGLYGTLWLMAIAYVTKYLPFGMRANQGSIAQIHKELEDAAMMSGATWWATFTRVFLPLLRPGLIAGWIYVFVISVRELSTSMLLATTDSVVLSILIYDMFDGGQSTGVAALAVMLILVLVLVVSVVLKLSGRIGLRVM